MGEEMEHQGGAMDVEGGAGMVAVAAADGDGGRSLGDGAGVAGEAGGVVVGDNGLDDDDLQEGSVSRLFAQLRPQKWTRVFQYTLRTFFFFSFLV